MRRSRRTWAGRHPAATGTLAALVLLTPLWVSLGSALTNPALGLSVPARFAEWLRDNGGGSLVNTAENWWYSHHQPAVGGRPSAEALPSPQHTRVLATGVRHDSPVHLPVPAPLTPFASPALPGEGSWRPVGRLVRGVPAVYETFLRPDSIHTSVVDGIAWMDTKLLSATLYSGSYIPGGGPYTYTAPVQPSAAASLVAAFNAGFRMQDANGGYYTQGQTIIPLRAGAASFVIYRNGRAIVGAWGTDVKMSSDVVAVRQNLSLLVEDGRPVSGLNANDTTTWGNTLGNRVYVSRSGIGITSDGALVYVGGPSLNITDLANLLVRAGAVRAMELDINTDWVNYATFAPPTPTGLASPTNGTDLLPLADMAGPPTRYFDTWWARDFITMSARQP
ncbi:MAG: phosphodiester glycosidase family protein [Acidimicrobiales bacterium]